MTDQQFQTLLALNQDIKTDMNRRFEQVDEQIKEMKNDINRRFEQVDEQMKELKFEIREMKHDVQSDRDKLQEVYESRNRVTVNFTKSWAMASFFISMLSATVVLAVTNAF